MIYCDRRRTCAQFYKGDSVLHLFSSQHCLGGDFRREEFLGQGHFDEVHHPVHIVTMAFSSYEHFEIAIERVADHSFYVAFECMDVVVGREGLGHYPVHYLLARIVERIGLDSIALEIIDFLEGDGTLAVSPLESRTGCLLAHLITRQVHNGLADFYLEFRLGLKYGFLQGSCHLGRIEHEGVPYALGRCFLVVEHLDVLVVYLSYRNGDFRSTKVYRRNISFIHNHFLQIICLSNFTFTVL